MRILVEENASTGYLWEFLEDAADDLFTSEDRPGETQNTGGMLGVPGYREFTLTGAEEGEAEFRIGLFGPGEDSLMEQEIEFDVSVVSQ